MRLKNLLKQIRAVNPLYNYSPPFGSYNYMFYLLHPWEYVEDLWLAAKWFYQRGSRGYADCDVWGLDWHLTSYMGKALRDLAEQVHGTPILDTGRVIEDPNDCDTFTIEEWKATILYIAETFDVGRKIQDFEYKDREEFALAKNRFDHGMRMFNEYFFNLWD